MSRSKKKSMIDQQKAIAVLKKRIEANPKDYRLYYSLGVIYEKGEKYPQAINAFKDALIYSKGGIRPLSLYFRIRRKIYHVNRLDRVKNHHQPTVLSRMWNLVKVLYIMVIFLISSPVLLNTAEAISGGSAIRWTDLWLALFLLIMYLFFVMLLVEAAQKLSGSFYDKRDEAIFYPWKIKYLLVLALINLAIIIILAAYSDTHFHDRTIFNTFSAYLYLRLHCLIGSILLLLESLLQLLYIKAHTRE